MIGDPNARLLQERGVASLLLLQQSCAIGGQPPVSAQGFGFAGS
jgi:hypothetical protein